MSIVASYNNNHHSLFDLESPLLSSSMDYNMSSLFLPFQFYSNSDSDSDNMFQMDDYTNKNFYITQYSLPHKIEYESVTKRKYNEAFTDSSEYDDDYHDNEEDDLPSHDYPPSYRHNRHYNNTQITQSKYHPLLLRTLSCSSKPSYSTNKETNDERTNNNTFKNYYRVPSREEVKKMSMNQLNMIENNLGQQPQISTEEKKKMNSYRRLINNREYARSSRERKKMEMEQLKNKLHNLEKENNELRIALREHMNHVLSK